MSQPAYLATNTVLSGRYVIASHFGGGGFGQTYLANDRQLPGHPLCVVKQFKPHLTDPAALQIARRLFETEAQALYQLGNHNQIPRLFAHFEENQEFFLVQEFIEGHGLDQELVAGRRLSETETTAILAEILEVVAFIHQQNVIHRDIKPANIIRRSGDQRLVLIDFGAVKQVSSEVGIASGKTVLTVAIGTPGYMPNEQSNGKPRLASDVYAIGLIGIQALTGLLPQQLYEDAQTGELVWHNQAQASPKLIETLDRMVRSDVRQRYQNAIEARQALLNPDPPLATQALPGSAHIPSTVLSTELTNRQPASKFWIIGGVSAAAIVGAAVFANRDFLPQVAPSPQTSTPIATTPTQPPAASQSTPEVAPSGIASDPTAVTPTQTLNRSSTASQDRTSEEPKRSPQAPTQPRSKDRWQLMGAATTGERVYVDNQSIRGAKQARSFDYRIGDQVIQAKAECNNNRWFATGYGWYSPQSQATQSMMSYVCGFNP